MGKADEHRFQAAGLSHSVRLEIRLEIKVAPGCHRGCWCEPFCGCNCCNPAQETSGKGNDQRVPNRVEEEASVHTFGVGTGILYCL